MHNLTAAFPLAFLWLDPGGLIAWILVGAISGWLAGKLSRGRGFGCLGNIGIGLVGAFVGSIIVAFLPFYGQVHTCGTIIVATLGACVLLWLANLISGRADRTTP